MNFLKLFNQILGDLEILGLDTIAADLIKLKDIHEAATKPKTRKATKPKEAAKMVRLYITEGDVTSALVLEEKKAEAFAKTKKKEHDARVSEYLKAKRVLVPSSHLYGYNNEGREKRKKEVAEYWRAMDDAGMVLSVRFENIT